MMIATSRYADEQAADFKTYFETLDLRKNIAAALAAGAAPPGPNPSRSIMLAGYSMRDDRL